MALVGQTGTQKPHPVQLSPWTAGRRRSSNEIASHVQAILQLMQTTPSQARQFSRDRIARPTASGLPVCSGPATGQTLKQSPQKVQPAAANER